MAVFKVFKEVSVLPAPLQANAIYLVRTGPGFELYVTDSTASVAYKVNNQVAVGTVAPSSPAVNDLWVDTN